jgi:hypothetical protein
MTPSCVVQPTGRPSPSPATLVTATRQALSQGRTPSFALPGRHTISAKELSLGPECRPTRTMSVPILAPVIRRKAEKLIDAPSMSPKLRCPKAGTTNTAAPPRFERAARTRADGRSPPAQSYPCRA